MFNNNSNNRNIFRENSSHQSEEDKNKFKLQLSAGAILILGILKLIFGMSGGFQSDLFTVLIILLVSTCGNGLIVGYLVISLIFDLIITCVFFILQLQNFLLNIPNPMTSNSLIILWILNILGSILYFIAIFYCYRLFGESTNSRQRGYTRLNDQPYIQNQSSTYGTMSDRESNLESNRNFKAFSGKGTSLDG